MANEVLAIGWSIVANLGGDRQITFQSAFAEDMTAADKNRILDETMKLVDRQRAISERPGLIKELQEHKETLAQYIEDQERLELQFPEQKAALEAQLEALQDEEAHEKRRDEYMAELGKSMTTLQKQRAEEFNAGYKEFLDSGRGGEYKPRGTREANLKKLDAAIDQAKGVLVEALTKFEEDRLSSIEASKAKLSSMDAERKTALENLGVSQKRYAQAIASREERLKEIDKILEG